jgi:hypothetical protein
LTTWREAFGYIPWQDWFETEDLPWLADEIPSVIPSDSTVANWIAENIEEYTKFDLGSVVSPEVTGRNQPLNIIAPSLGAIFKYIPQATHWDEMNLDVPLYNLLRRKGMDTFSGISSLNLDQIRALDHFGEKTLNTFLLALVRFQAAWFRDLLSVATSESFNVDGDIETESAENRFSLDPLNFEWFTRNAGLPVEEIISALNILALQKRLQGNGDDSLITPMDDALLDLPETPLFTISANEWLSNVAVPDLADFMDGLISTWTEVEVNIALDRLVTPTPKTLEEIGGEFNLTRERIRQLEQKIKKGFEAHVQSSWQFRTALHALKFQLTEPKTEEEVASVYEHLTVDHLGHRVNLVRLLIGLGELEQRDSWICSDFLTFDNLFDNVWQAVSSDGISVSIETFKVSYEELGSSYSSEFLDSWMEYYGYAVFDGHWYLKRGKSLPDLAEAILSIKQAVMSSDEIFEALKVDRSIRSLHNSMISSDKFIRTSKQGWGLAVWDLEEYTGIRDAILKFVEENRSVSLTYLVDTFVEKFGVKPSSVESYAQSYPLQLSEGMVVKATPRTSNRHRKTVAQTRNLYKTRHGLTLRLRINSEHLRGSGSPCPAALASFLNLSPLERRRFDWEHGTFMVSDQGNVTNISSVRVACDRLGIGLGDELLLTFDGVTVRAEKLVSQEDEAGYLAQILKQEENETLIGALGFALEISDTPEAKTVLSALSDRGETDLVSVVRQALSQ